MGLGEVAFRPPRLETRRLVLRGWEPADATAIFSYASDPEVARYVSWERHVSPRDAQTFLDRQVAAAYEREELDYAIAERHAPERAIGGIGLRWRWRDDLVMELGYVLARRHWGKGLMPEAGRELIDHAFSTTPVERIFAPIFTENVKSWRAAAKMGLRLEGVLRSSLKLRGRRWDQAIYAVVRSDDRSALEHEPYAAGR